MNLRESDWRLLRCFASQGIGPHHFCRGSRPVVERLLKFGAIEADGLAVKVTREGVLALLYPPHTLKVTRPRQVPCHDCNEMWDAYDWPSCPRCSASSKRRAK